MEERSIDKIVRMHREGMANKTIAARLNVSDDYVRRILRESMGQRSFREVTPSEYARLNWERSVQGARAARLAMGAK